jgi:hypothetical protein
MDRVVTSDRFATLTFERRVAAPVDTLWHAWLAPAARALWAAPNANVTVEFIETSTEVGGREVSLCTPAIARSIQRLSPRPAGPTGWRLSPPISSRMARKAASC